LYKTHIDEILLKSASNAEANNQDQSKISNNSNLDRTSDVSFNTTSKTNITNVIENKDSNKFKFNQDIQYRKLCEKIGFDLTNVGQLVVNLKSCDRLPESLYSLNFPQITNQTTHPSNNPNSQLPLTASLSSNQLALLPTQEKPSCKIYFTVSVDSLSMNNLMDKQICKEHWPLIEFELTLLKNKRHIVCVQRDFAPNKNIVKLKSSIGTYVLDDLNSPANQQYIDINTSGGKINIIFNLKITKTAPLSLDFNFVTPSSTDALLITNFTFTKLK
jgi:hypothetical protein